MKPKTALITGASRGIGRAIALKFAQNGYNLIINCIHNKDKLALVKQEVLSLQRSYLYAAEKPVLSSFASPLFCFEVICDTGDFLECNNSFLNLFNQLKGLELTVDVLVNNAGISYIGLLQDMSYEDWKRVIDTNLGSVFNMSKLVLPLMLKSNHGKIINISSVWGSAGASCEAAYSASKGGINALTKALAKELAPNNIQVNCIACGAIATDMNTNLEPEAIALLKEEIPAGRLGKPEEIADMVFYLADKDTYTNGAVITVDGGWI
jgi:putative uncharacterized protein (fragment)